MSVLKYIARSIWFFRKQHMAVFAGTVISTAVLTGALIVGDSVKYSLKHLVDVRLGQTSYVLQTGDRFVESSLALDLESELMLPATSVLLLKGIGINPEDDKRVNTVQVVGMEKGFGTFFNTDPPHLQPGDALISRNVANKLNLIEGNEFLLRVEDVSVIPLNAPFAQDAVPSVGIRLKVKAVLADDQMGRFSLNSNQAAPYNVLVDREYLAEEIELGNLVNTVLVAREEGVGETLERVNETFKKVWKTGDLGIRIHDLSQAGQYEVQSDRIFIDPPIARTLMESDLSMKPLLTYLVNAIYAGDNSTPYSFITAAAAPYVNDNIKDGEVIINDWLASDLHVKTGDSIQMDYFVVGPMRKLNEKSQGFVVAGITPTGIFPADSTLMPKYPGLAGANSCREWETGIPIDLNRIRDKDEFYWEDYKGTPKGLITFSQGQKLWENDFGYITALRVNKSEISKEALQEIILKEVDPSDLNLYFRDVRQQGFNAADNSVDFGELFLSLSFFVIVAGVLLTVLLYSLHTQSRMMETGVLAALGFRKRTILWIRFMESFAIAVIGGVAGTFAGMLYNFGLISGLNSVWTDAVHTDVLQIYVLPRTLFVGFVAGVVIALLSIYIVTLRKLKNPITVLLKNFQLSEAHIHSKRPWILVFIMMFGLVASFVLILYSLLSGIDQNAGMFLASGGLFIVGILGWLGLFLRRKSLKKNNIAIGTADLALLNVGRNRTRSMTTIALFALGTFTIIITGANRKSFYGSENNRQSGTGGFLYWAEATMPLPYDLQTEEGRGKLGLDDQQKLTDNSIVQFMALDGDDASCLNLNQVQQPRILGVDPKELQKRNAFSFAKLLEGIDPENAWDELNNTYSEQVIPVYADQTVITWGLIKKVGDTLHYTNEAGKTIHLLLAGGFNNSIFQGNLLMGLDHFRENFPSVSGSSILLLENEGADSEEYPSMLEQQLVDYGITITPTRERLAQFNSVTNTYLSVFMALGGLGVIIGTIGLGIVLLRNMMERKRELALLTALGFHRNELMVLTMLENIFLLFAGFATGVLGALIGILPSLLSPAFTIPGFFMLWLIIAILASGLIWIWVPARRIAKLPLVPSLRNE